MPDAINEDTPTDQDNDEAAEQPIEAPQADIELYAASVSESIEIAKILAIAGVPLFIAKPALNSAGRWDPKGGHNGTGYWMPKNWQNLPQDPDRSRRVIDAYEPPGIDPISEPGQALCAVTGVVFDVIDIDPQNGGSADKLPQPLPPNLGVQRTPSGGQHLLIPRLFAHTLTDIYKGIDLKSGLKATTQNDPDDDTADPAQQGKDLSRGFIFLAPTAKRVKSKVEGAPTLVKSYTWSKAPNEKRLLNHRLQQDTALDPLRAIAESRGSLQRSMGTPYEGPGYEDLSDWGRAQSDTDMTSLIDYWNETFQDAVNWPDGFRDEKNRGWETLTRNFAWSMGLQLVKPWTSLQTFEEAQEIYSNVVPPEIANNHKCLNKFTLKLIDRIGEATKEEMPDWLEMEIQSKAALEASGEDDDRHDGSGGGDDDDDTDTPQGPGPRPFVNIGVPGSTSASDWLATEIGKPGSLLAGIFLSAGKLTHVPRIGEDGYKPLPETKTTLNGGDGPAQIRAMHALGLCFKIDHLYSVHKQVGAPGGRGRQTLVSSEFPMSAAKRLEVGVLDGESVHATYLRTLGTVVHTPVVLPMGDLLFKPGYDSTTETLYLPSDKQIEQINVSLRPTKQDVKEAVKTVEALLQDFNFATEHDKANAWALLLSPFFRLFATPYPMTLINAPERNSGKSTLAEIVRILHGGVMRGGFPESKEELQKQIVSILSCTTAPIVQFDNVRSLKGDYLDAMLTSRSLDDRVLGSTNVERLYNNRVWVATGNNVMLHNDLVRRTVKIQLNALTPSEREKGRNFHIQGITKYVEANRAEILGKLLTLVQDWILAGQPLSSARKDSFDTWISHTQGLLDHIGVEGRVDHKVTRPDEPIEDTSWGECLEEASHHFKQTRWRAKDFKEWLVFNTDSAPTELAGERGQSVKSIGWWLLNRNGRWSSGYRVVQDGKDSKGAWWKIEMDKSYLESHTGDEEHRAEDIL